MPEVLDLRSKNNSKTSDRTAGLASDRVTYEIPEPPPRQKAQQVSDEEEGAPHKRKINSIIGLFLIAYMLVIDVIGIVLVVFGLDDFFILDVLSWPVTWLYFRIKGVNGAYNNIMSIAEVFPYVGALPLKTLGVILVLWMDRHPDGKVARSVDKASVVKLKKP
jgi:hypothetical protein